MAKASGFTEHRAESHRTTHEMDWISQAVFLMGVGYVEAQKHGGGDKSGAQFSAVW